MKKILLATDFSAASLSALNYAIALNKYFKAELLVLNVVQEHAALPMDDHLQLEIEDQKMNAAKRSIQRWLRPYPDQFENLEVIPDEMKFSVRPGPITPTILEVAEEEQVDWIIIGAKAKHHWWEYFLGNISTQLLQQSAYSLLIIPEHVRFANIEQIALASPDATESVAIFSKLKPFARAVNGVIKKVHVAISKEETYKEQEEGVWVEVVSKNVTKGLNEFAGRHKVDMICLDVPQKSFWSQITHHSVSREMVLETTVPLMILKEK